MRNFAEETQARVRFIQGILDASGAEGIVFGNSGGKDSALTGILCKLACEHTLGLILPCASRRNLEEDRNDALALAERFDIETLTVDLTETRAALVNVLGDFSPLPDAALTNLAPRLRMTALYAAAAARGYLVAGTGNRSERHVGYFTKWGDGGCDFNPIADLTVGEIYEFLTHLDAPESIIRKPPSAALYDGQTDEAEMGILYADLDRYLLTGQAEPEVKANIERMHRASEHKRTSVPSFQF